MSLQVLYAVVNQVTDTTSANMSPIPVVQRGRPSPPPENAFVTVHALSAGRFTLPEYQFVQPVSKDARRSVPSLAFLFQHHDVQTGKQTRIVFDLGLRRDVNRYDPAIQRHATTRQPMNTDPDVVKSLSFGGLTPDDIDFVLYSHASMLDLILSISTESALSGTLGSRW